MAQLRGTEKGANRVTIPSVPTVEVNQVLRDSSSMFIFPYEDIDDLKRTHTNTQDALGFSVVYMSSRHTKSKESIRLTFTHSCKLGPN